MKYDLAIIGGGIVGAGIARDATLRGLKVALLEKDDFGAGTTSCSTRLIHGGLRYLTKYEFDLAYEALRERLRNLNQPDGDWFDLGKERSASFVFPSSVHPNACGAQCQEYN